jgi:hypothetical protein
VNRLFEGNTRLWRDVEKFAPVHSCLGFVEHLSCVRQRHDAFADAESPNVDLVTKPLGNLSDKVALVPFRFDVDIGLRFDEGAHVAFDIERTNFGNMPEKKRKEQNELPVRMALTWISYCLRVIRSGP